MGKWAKERERGDADGSGMTQIGSGSVVACLYEIGRSTSLTAVRSENFFRGKVVVKLQSINIHKAQS